LADLKQIDQQIQTIDEKLKKAPSANLICAKNGNAYKWYQTDGKNRQYLPKSQRRLAEKLAAKKYLSLLKDDLIREKNAIRLYLKHHNWDIYKSDQLLLDNPEYQKLLFPHFKPTSKELHEWMNSPYDKLTQHPESLIHPAPSGNMVRSKSEAIIDMVLHTNKIPFRYECPLQINNCIFYPDFTIRHPKTKETFYWEHFGLMDDEEYQERTRFKLKQYIDSGITPTINLITTYEDKEHPLSIKTVRDIVSQYFL
jgi:predicted nuclease of restriction endonuclease-like RecB superfamily